MSGKIIDRCVRSNPRHLGNFCRPARDGVEIAFGNDPSNEACTLQIWKKVPYAKVADLLRPEIHP